MIVYTESLNLNLILLSYEQFIRYTDKEIV